VPRLGYGKRINFTQSCKDKRENVTIRKDHKDHKDRGTNQKTNLYRLWFSSVFVSFVIFVYCSLVPLPFASLADVAKGGDGAKSALREIFSVFGAAV
jgi:hypothetical protein